MKALVESIGGALQKRQIPAFPRDEIEGLVKAFDMLFGDRTDFDRIHHMVTC
jgi:hypothetical protein